MEIAKAINVAIIRVFWDPQSGSESTGWSTFLKKNLLSQITTAFLPETMVLALGSLYRTLIATAVYTTGTGSTTITWATANENNQLATDESHCFLIDENENQFWYDVTTAAARSTGTTDVVGPAGLTATEVHAYLWFSQDLGGDDEYISDSQYLICAAP